MNAKFRFLAIILTLFIYVPTFAASERNLVAKPSQPTEKRVALVIGNAAYGTAPLKNPVNDARAIAAKLQKLGFDVVKRENLTTKQIGSTLRDFRSRLTPGAEAIFFYAGHGLQVKGANYLPTIDAEITSEEDVPNQSINVMQLLEIMDDSKTRLNLIFLDACRNNPFTRRFRSTGGGLARIDAPSGTKISFATRPGSVASDGERANGLYTEHLLRVMDERGLPIEQALKKIYSGVKQASKGSQEPWEEGTIEGEFFFSPPNEQSPSNLQRPPTVRLQTPEEIEQELWDTIKSSSDPRDIESYISSYPNGRFIALARQKLKVLISTSSPPLQTANTPISQTNGTQESNLKPNESLKDQIVQISAPDLAENGAVIPVTLSFSQPVRTGDRVELFFGNNLAAVMNVLEGEVSSWSLRLALPNSGVIRAQTSRHGGAEKMVRVTIGGDNSRLANSPQIDVATAKIRTKAGETRMLIGGAFSRGKLVIAGGGFRVLLTGSPYLSLNPVMGFQGSIRDGDQIQLSLNQ